jgi:hypothetical protein
MRPVGPMPTPLRPQSGGQAMPIHSAELQYNHRIEWVQSMTYLHDR